MCLHLWAPLSSPRCFSFGWLGAFLFLFFPLPYLLIYIWSRHNLCKTNSLCCGGNTVNRLSRGYAKTNDTSGRLWNLSKTPIHLGHTETAPENGVDLTYSLFPIFNLVHRFIFNVINGVGFMGLQFHFTMYSTLWGFTLALAGKDTPQSEIHFPFFLLNFK